MTEDPKDKKTEKDELADEKLEDVAGGLNVTKNVTESASAAPDTTDKKTFKPMQ